MYFDRIRVLTPSAEGVQLRISDFPNHSEVNRIQSPDRERAQRQRDAAIRLIWYFLFHALGLRGQQPDGSTGQVLFSIKQPIP